MAAGSVVTDVWAVVVVAVQQQMGGGAVVVERERRGETTREILYLYLYKVLES